MTEKEKAKAYDEAIERAKKLYGNGIAEEIFTELKEDDTERIRKNCIHFLELQKQHHAATFEIEECIDWLEKQGEQKPQGKSALEAIKEENVDNANKVEPKFKVGNWYQCIKDFFGKCVTFDKNTAYYCAKEGCLQDEYGCHIAIVKDLYDNFKLWTIEDAKDGDVIFYDEGWICIFKCIHGIWYSSYCFITDDGEFHTGYERHAVDSTIHGNAHPATKEQRDILMKAMNDAGYEWDAEKKKLKKF